MINKILKEYVEKDNNIESNYNAIFSKMEGNHKKNFMRKLASSAAAILAILVVGTASVQVYAKIAWDIQFKEYQNREYKYGVGNKDLTEKVEMEYIEQDGIKVKVDSIMTTDEHFEAKINFAFDENIQLNSETFQFGYAVYDENNNIYGIMGGLDHGNKNTGFTYHNKCIYRELGLNTKKDLPLANSLGSGVITSQNRNIISKINIDSRKGFPSSRKLFIRIFDLEYYMQDSKLTNSNLTEQEWIALSKQTEYFRISDAEWIFEINVPENIYSRETINLDLKEYIPELEIKHIKVTDTGFIMQGNMEELYNACMNQRNLSKEELEQSTKELINITDNKGNTYYYKNIGSTGEKFGFSCSFEINKDMLKDRKIFLNINVNGKHYSSEIIQIK